MKIIEGSLAGTQIQYKEQRGTRVTSEKVRKSVFDVLKNLIDFDGLNIADLFCGSGMYGIEAMSRGAKSATLVDESKSVVDNLKRNIKDIEKLRYYDIKILNKKFENFIVHHGSILHYGRHAQEYGTNGFDLVFADPPYYDFDFEKLNNIHKILNTDGIFVLESSKRIKIGELEKFELLVEKKYGDARVIFYKKT